MPTQLQIRRGTSTEHNSFTGAAGELTVDTTKDTVVVHDGSTAGGFPLARADGSNLAITNNVTFSDSVEAIFGDGSDLKLYHTGSHSYIDESGTGNLYIGSNNGGGVFIQGSGETLASFLDDGAVTLNYDNSPRIATTSAGASITGSVTATSLDVTGSVTAGTNFTFANNNTDNTNKEGHFLARQYDSGTETEGFQVLQYFANSSVNRVDVGGASSAYNAATGINFYTAANATTRTGKKRLDIASNGDVSLYEDTGTTAKLAWKSSDERLGLGTASPAQKLHIYDATAANQAVRLGNPAQAGTYGEIQYDPSGFEHLYIKSKGTATGYGNIVFQTGVTPTTALTLNAAGEASFANDILLGDAKVARFGNDQDFRISFDSHGIIQNVTSDSDILFKGKDGSSTITALKLDMSEAGAATFNGDVYIRTVTTPSATVAGFYFGQDQLYTSAGTTTTSNYQVRFYNGNGLVGAITTNGSATAYLTSSDYRLKENVVELSGATERLKQLKPSRFNFIADADKTVDGFLAHEVQDIVPEAITGAKDEMMDEEYEVTPAVLDDDGNVVTEAVLGTRSVESYQGIDQSKLVPLLVATIQELEARIVALES